MRNRQHRQQQAQVINFVAKMVSHGAKGLVRGANPSKACTLSKAQGLVITPDLICYLKHYIIRHVHSPDEVNDRVQDSLLEALQAYPEYKGDSTLKTWLIGITKHQIAHYYRLADNAPEHHCPNESINTDYLNQEDEEYQATRRQELLQGLFSLSKAYYQLLYWHAVEGLRHAEIGKKLGISEGAVNMRISRARAALRKTCEKK